MANECFINEIATSSHGAQCDLCQILGYGYIPATYYALTIYGWWGRMCNDCFAEYGFGLGPVSGYVIAVTIP